MNLESYVKYEVNDKSTQSIQSNTLQIAKKHLGQLVSDNRLDLKYFELINEFINNITLKNADSILSLLNNNEYIDLKKIIDSIKILFRLNKSSKLSIKKTVWKGLKNISHIKLTDEQLKCGKKLLKFIKNSNETTFGLYGYAGTGKTTTTVEIISYLIKNGFIKSVVFTAPTNKAVNVIKSKFRIHLKDIYEKYYSVKLDKDFDFENILDKLYTDNIKIDFITIHRLLEFKIDYNSDGGLIFIRNNCIKQSKKKSSLMNQYEIVIIDECSMIPMDLLDVIFNEIRKLNNSPKVVFTGDPAQLPPVNETQSFIFLKNPEELTLDEYVSKMHSSSVVSITSDIDDILEEKRSNFIKDIMNMKTFTLKKVVRSKIDNVTNFCYEIRRWVNNEEQNPDLQSFNNKKGIKIYDYLDNIIKTKTKWFKNCVKNIKKGKSSIILTWTNKQSDLYNSIIRKKMFGGDILDKYVIGDILMLTEFYCLDNYQDNEYNEYNEESNNKLYTSDQIIVICTKKCYHQIKNFEFMTNTSIRKIKKTLCIEQKLRQLINIINSIIKNRKYQYWKLDVKKIGDNDEHTIKVLCDHVVEDYNKLKENISINIINFSKQLLGDCSEKQIENLILKPLWKQWHEIFISPFANVNYGYSITCHKGQGSNFFNVYVDIHDISKNGNFNEVKKCIYTAVTRTVNKLYMLV